MKPSCFLQGVEHPIIGEPCFLSCEIIANQTEGSGVLALPLRIEFRGLRDYGSVTVTPDRRTLGSEGGGGRHVDPERFPNRNRS